MAGGQLKRTRIGSPAERLAEYFLSGIAFTTPVPRQEDVGHDFHCVLARRPDDSQMVLAGPSFAVQVKSRRQRIRYETEAAQTWIASQENPFFVCFADPRESRVDLYSTCTLVPGLLHHGKSVTVLEPDVPTLQGNIRKDKDDVLHIPLGPPVLSLTMGDVQEDDDLARWAAILEHWIEIDRQNIVNRRARIHWAHWPIGHRTNEPLDEVPATELSFFWDVKNLGTSRYNLLRVATPLRLELAHLDASDPDTPFATDGQRAALDALLVAFWSELGATARENIRRVIPEGDWPETS